MREESSGLLLEIRYRLQTHGATGYRAFLALLKLSPRYNFGLNSKSAMPTICRLFRLAGVLYLYELKPEDMGPAKDGTRNQIRTCQKRHASPAMPTLLCHLV